MLEVSTSGGYSYFGIEADATALAFSCASFILFLRSGADIANTSPKRLEMNPVLTLAPLAYSTVQAQGM